MASTVLPGSGHHDPGSTRVTTRRPDGEASPPLVPRLLVEFIGTFFLVVTVCAAISPKTGAGPLAPLAIGSILMVMVFAGGHISGGHYNPAVSLAVLIRGKLTVGEWAGYTVTQLAAGVVGGLVASGIVGRGHLQAAAVAGTLKVFIVEMLFTFALAYVVLNVATARHGEGNSYFGLAIGFTVTAGALAVGGISGGAFNPAVALGVTVLGRFAWTDLWIYVMAALVGAAIAATAFLYIQSAERN